LEMGHFWVGSGPYILKTVSPLAKIVVLRRFEEYPDPSDKWFFLTQPLEQTTAMTTDIAQEPR
jgi:peptide/nickel transport system substrate-binding protein